MVAIQVLLGLILIALVVIARDLRIVAKARAYDMRNSGKRESVIGFGPTLIPAGESITFEAEPSTDFGGNRLIVPSALANDFTIDDIAADGESQAISGNPIPAVAFSELAIGVNLGLDTVAKKKKLQLKVSNTTKEAKSFAAALIGFVPKGSDGLGALARAVVVDTVKAV